MKTPNFANKKHVVKTLENNPGEKQSIELVLSALTTAKDVVEAFCKHGCDCNEHKGYAPSSPATVDNQGDLNLCTRSAIAKAIVELFDKDACGVGRTLDMNQNAVLQVLCNEHKNGTGKWPTDFDNKSYQLQEMKDSSWMNTKISVKEVNKLTFQTEMTSGNNHYQYVLVDDEGNRRSHCMYVKELKNKVITCINSHGDTNNPEPQICLDKPKNRFYRVICKATKICSCTIMSTCTHGTNPISVPLPANISPPVTPNNSTQKSASPPKKNFIQENKKKVSETVQKGKQKVSKMLTMKKHDKTNTKHPEGQDEPIAVTIMTNGETNESEQSKESEAKGTNKKEKNTVSEKFKYLGVGVIIGGGVAFLTNFVRNI